MVEHHIDVWRELMDEMPTRFSLVGTLVNPLWVYHNFIRQWQCEVRNV